MVQAVLAHAILMAHSHSQYKYRLVAFVHPEVVVARPFLSFLGWEVLERPVPVEISQVYYAVCLTMLCVSL